MKKILITLTCLTLSFSCFMGCSRQNESIAQKSYEVDGETVSEIRIDVRDRQIEVLPSSDNQIHIDYFETDKEYYDLSLSQDQVLTMTFETSKELTDYIGEKPAAGSRKISLHLPKTQLDALTLSTTNEDISLPPLTSAGNVSLSSNGGNILLDRLEAENTISLDAKNGNISGSILGSYDDYAIFCETKKGQCNLPVKKENGAKTLSVVNNNGDVNLDFVAD